MFTWVRRLALARGRRPERLSFRPSLEGLEDRLLMNAGFVDTTLVSNVAGSAVQTDPQLTNPAGLAYNNSGGPFIVANGNGFALAYNGDGTSASATQQNIIIPGPGSGSWQTSSPTAVLFNNTTGFNVTSNGQSVAAEYLFATANGTISGWSPSMGTNRAVNAVDNSSSGADYTGLALDTNAAGTFLYAADFGTGTIDVFNPDFSQASVPSGAFTDPNLPTGYAPLGIQNIGGNLYVTYGLKNGTGNTPTAGAGNGYIDVYNANGTLLSRFASNGNLNAPWAVAVAPSSFGPYGGDLLVGNFGNGQINAYNASNGTWVGTLSDVNNNPLTIAGLSAMTFGNGAAAGSASTLYYTGGTPGQSKGIFGAIAPNGSSTITPPPTTPPAANGPVTVGPLTLQGTNLALTPNNAFSGTVATLTDSNFIDQASSFTAVISWGDGTPTSTGTVTTASNGTFTITGAHTYSTTGTYNVAVTVAGGLNNFSVTAPLTAVVSNNVSSSGSLTLQGPNLTLTPGTAYNGSVATLTDTNLTDTAGSFTAAINWGDGSALSSGVLTSLGNGMFTVNGTHTYSGSGTYNVVVAVAGGSGNSTITTQLSAVVSTSSVTNGPLTLQGTGLALQPATPFSGTVATLTDTNLTDSAGSFTATINWGDGTPATIGVVTATGSGTYNIAGTHTYSLLGSYNVSVTLTGGSASTTLTAQAPAEVGSANQRYVNKLYEDLLGRPAETFGLNYWTAVLTTYQGRAGVVSGIEHSAEYEARVINGYYETLLGRPADPGGLGFWGAVLSAGGSTTLVETGILGSAEYYQREGATATGLLNGIYQAVLGRSPTATEQQTWLPQVSSGTNGTVVASDLLDTTEGAADEIQGLYQAFLHRAADSAGLNQFVTLIQTGTSVQSLILTLTTSDEYFNRA